ncbi:MAG: type III pantothenate kinase [Chloroflexota bacterium]
MLLAIDIGNTNVVLGVWDKRKWKVQWRLRTDRARTVDEYGISLKTLLRESRMASSISRVVMSSVVPPLTAVFTFVVQKYLGFDPLLITPQLDTGITIRTDNPNEVGADRIVNSVAAAHLFPGPSIVIDMGTATTFDIVSANKELLGVVIAPGVRLAADALTSRAAQLSGVALEAPPHAIGTNTIHAIQSGIVFGYTALVEGVVRRLLAEHPDRDQQVQIIGTGGLVNLIHPHTEIIDHYDPALTLTGLRLVSERHQ